MREAELELDFSRLDALAPLYLNDTFALKLEGESRPVLSSDLLIESDEPRPSHRLLRLRRPPGLTRAFIRFSRPGASV